jgi:hypothetical protein
MAIPLDDPTLSIYGWFKWNIYHQNGFTSQIAIYKWLKWLVYVGLSP